MSSEIKLFVTFQDGTYQTVSIGPLKPIGALFEKLNEIKGSPVHSLYKNGVQIPKSKEMIKYIPLKNGDKLTEGGPSGKPVNYKNVPMHSYQNSVLREKVTKGTVPKESVMEIRIYTDSLYPTDVMVMKTATLDDLKVTISEIIQRPVQELSTNPRLKTFLGWSDDIENEGRVYNGKQKLVDLGVVDGSILGEIPLPRTKQEIQREKEEMDRKAKEFQEAARRFAEARKKAQEEARRQWEFEEMMRKIREAERAAEAEKKAKEQRYVPPPPPRPVNISPDEQCKALLRKNKILTKKDFLKWAIKNHPDKVGPNEKNTATKKFQEVSNCADRMKILYATEDWEIPAHGGKKKSKTRKAKRGLKN
jgi:hypothetical protein